MFFFVSPSALSVKFICFHYRENTPTVFSSLNTQSVSFTFLCFIVHATSVSFFICYLFLNHVYMIKSVLCLEKVHLHSFYTPSFTQFLDISTATKICLLTHSLLFATGPRHIYLSMYIHFTLFYVFPFIPSHKLSFI